MARTFTTLQTEALGNDFSASTFPGTMVGTYLNDALKELTRRINLPTSVASATASGSANDSSYTLPSDFVELLSVFDADRDAHLVGVTKQNMDEMGEQNGPASFYAVEGSTLYVFPFPDDPTVLRIDYRALPTDIAGSTGITSTIPDDYGDLLVAFARHRMFRFEDDPEMSAFWKAEFEDGVKRLRGDSGLRSRIKRQIPGMWGRGTTSPIARRP